MSRRELSSFLPFAGAGLVAACGLKRAIPLAVVLLLAGCAVGPDYQRPLFDVGEQYLHAEEQALNSDAWVRAQPADMQGAGQWWTSFQDPLLDRLMLELHEHNADLGQAEARYRQATASLSNARAGFFPTLDSDVGGTRSGSGTSSAATNYNLALSASWEPDVWGRVRRSNEAAMANVEASQADFYATRLSLESTLAKTYFQAKNVYASQQLLDETLRTYEQVLEVTENRFDVGMAAQSDVVLARAQLENARIQRLALNRQQAQLHNAMAVLLGRPPSELEALELVGWPALPEVPVSLPAQLLERRPDVASAERRVMAANAQIGVARAAWFPNLRLSAQGGWRAGEWAQWLSAPARFWSLGPALALQLFDGGARSAQVNEAIANYDLQANGYKQAVLTALQEVEDGLAQWYGLAEETRTQQRALAASRESLTLIRNQYDAGLVDFLGLAQVATSTLSTERTTISLLSEQYIAAVSLMTGLGGGWDRSYGLDPANAPQQPAGLLSSDIEQE